MMKSIRVNPTEAKFEEAAVENGCAVTKRGWPDFLCLKDGEFMAVEVKPRTKKGKLTPLKSEQVVSLALLQQHGIPCFVSDGDECIPFNLNDHLPRVIRRISFRTSTIVLQALISGVFEFELSSRKREQIQDILQRRGLWG